MVPLGFGRNIQNPGTFQDLLREGVIDLVRPDLLVYGISGVCRIASMAETYYTAMAPWYAAGPIATSAALHAAASMPNFFILQIPGSGPGSAVIRNGFFELPKGPGLGVTVGDEPCAAEIFYVGNMGHTAPIFNPDKFAELYEQSLMNGVPAGSE